MVCDADLSVQGPTRERSSQVAPASITDASSNLSLPIFRRAWQELLNSSPIGPESRDPDSSVRLGENASVDVSAPILWRPGGFGYESRERQDQRSQNRSNVASRTRYSLSTQSNTSNTNRNNGSPLQRNGDRNMTHLRLPDLTSTNLDTTTLVTPDQRPGIRLIDDIPFSHFLLDQLLVSERSADPTSVERRDNSSPSSRLERIQRRILELQRRSAPQPSTALFGNRQRPGRLLQSTISRQLATRSSQPLSASLRANTRLGPAPPSPPPQLRIDRAQAREVNSSSPLQRRNVVLSARTFIDSDTEDLLGRSDSRDTEAISLASRDISHSDTIRAREDMLETIIRRRRLQRTFLVTSNNDDVDSEQEQGEMVFERPFC